MDEPNIPEPDLRGSDFRCAARTLDPNEADRLATQYSIQGFQTKIIKKLQGTLALYEVWVSKKPDLFSIETSTKNI